MTVRGLLFAACLALALTGANARAKDAERTEVRAESGSSGTTAASDSSPGFFRAFPERSPPPSHETRADTRPSAAPPRTQVYGIVPPLPARAPCHGGGRMGDQMALPSLGFRTVSFGGTGFFAVSSSRSSSGALGADAEALFFDGESAPLFALFAQPEHVTRAVYFSRSLGGFETNTKVDARGDDANGEEKDANEAPRAVGAAETSDGAENSAASRVSTARDFEAFDAFADAAARADSVMDALVRWRDVTSTRAVPREPFRAWFETGAPRESDAGAKDAALGVEFKPRAPRRVDANDADDDAPPPLARALVGASSLLLVVAAAVACVQAVLAACDWACRAVFGEEAEEADEVSAGSVDEVSLAAPLLDFAYETEERAISRARDEGGDGDGEQLLVLVPLEPEGRRTS